MKVKFNDVEISYILLHLVANIFTEKKQLIIDIGIYSVHNESTYKWIKNALFSNFTNINICKIDDINNYSNENIDLILIDDSISKHGLFSNKENVLFVNKFLNDIDIKKITNMIDEITINKKNIRQYLDIKKINSNSITDSIIQLSQDLKNTFFINDIYINNVIKDFNLNNKNHILHKSILLVHSSANQGVLKNGFAIILGILKNNINIHNYRIKYVLFVVPNANLNHIIYIEEIIDILMNNKKNALEEDLIAKIKKIWKKH